MPIGSIDGETLRVITERRDLGYGQEKHGNCWALRAYGATCDRQSELPYPYTLWHFPAHIRLAVERALAERSREREALPKAGFERVLGEIGSGPLGHRQLYPCAIAAARIAHYGRIVQFTPRGR